MFLRIFALFGCILSVSAFADLLPPEASGMAERFTNNPGAFDRHDVWCEGRSVGEACDFPGSAFEGGGHGLCERMPNRSDFQIDLLCVPKPQPRIERAIPSGPWHAGGSLCDPNFQDRETADILRGQGWVCTEPPVVSDRFCKGIEAGQRCIAEVLLDGRSERFDGVCKHLTERQSTYFRGRRVVTRPVLSCEPERPVPPATLTPVSAWRKLFQ